MIDYTVSMGTTGPKSHQRVIGKLMTALGHLFYREGIIRFEPFTETMIDESKTSPTPDVLLFDNEHGLNMVIIEVSGTTGAKKDFEKLVELMHDYDVPEGFVYIYPTGKWRKYTLPKGEVTENPSFCDTIGFDLNEFLQ